MILFHNLDYRESWFERWAQVTNVEGVQYHLRMYPYSWFSAGWTQWEWCHILLGI